tara:strand:+ start:705 stop:1073 length:369 start_codon:yes stop_codon:yes gene_type:complete
MALIFKDRVRQTSTTAGTGSMLLTGSVSGFSDWSVIGSGNTSYYAIVARGGSDWEVGLGTYLLQGGISKYLVRDTVLASSSSGTKVTFSSGTKDVFTTYPAGKAVDTTKAEEIAIQFAIALG